jgi:hypothetical protein
MIRVRLRALAIVLLIMPLLPAAAEDPASKMIDDEMNSELSIDPKIATAIAAIARDDRQPLELRERALHVLEIHHDRAHAPTALQIASHHEHAELAHYAAQSLLASHERLTHALRSSVRAIREEAAIASKKIDLVGVIVMDADEAPATRGRAIQSLIDAHSAEAHAVLLQLLEPKHWFFGVQAPVLRLHSLAFVIDGLDANEDREALELLRVQIASMPEHERDDVQWRLDEKLAQH